MIRRPSRRISIFFLTCGYCYFISCGQQSAERQQPTERHREIFGTQDFGWVPFELTEEGRPDFGFLSPSSSHSESEKTERGGDPRGKVFVTAGHFPSVARAVQIQTDGKILSIGLSTINEVDFLVMRQNTDGTLDTAFFTIGRVITDFSGNNDAAYGGVLQTDGRFVVFGGGAGAGAGSNFALARYNTDGTLDTSFNTAGKADTDISGVDVIYHGILQLDGKLVAVGTVNSVNFCVARYNSDGSLDSTFNTSGKVITDISGTDVAYGGVVQADGKIIAIGKVNNAVDFGLARYSTDGSLDTAFNSTGKVVTDISGTDIAYGGVLQTDGKVIAVGQTNSVDFAVVRYSSDGTLDTSFNSGGNVVTNVNGVDAAKSSLFEPDGKVVVAGPVGELVNFGMVRYNTDGTLDTSFNSSGKVNTDISGTDSPQASAFQSDLKIVLAGSTNNSHHFALARYTTDGVFDTSFHTKGSVINAATPGLNLLRAVVFQTNENLLAIGTTNSTTDFFVVRLNAITGVLDTSFNTNGQVTTDIVGADIAYAGVVQTDGKIVAMGAVNSLTNFGLVRYNTNGTLDTSFNSTGKMNADISGNDTVYGGFLQPDGKLIAIGTVTSWTNFGVARFNTDGTFDTSFNSSGKAISDISGTDTAYGGILQSDGKILAFGNVNSSLDFALTRYSTDGSIDTSFNSTGKVTTDISGFDSVYAGVLQTDGKTIVVGSANLNTDFALARYNTDGTLDTSFNSTGKFLTNISGIDVAYAVKISNRSKIVVVGKSNGNFAIARYLSNGTLDTTFHTSGFELLTIGQGTSIAYGLAIDSRGYYVVGGQAVSGNVNAFTLIKIAP